MVKVMSNDRLRRIMDNKQNIRNMSVIGHASHGKSCVTDNLLAAAAGGLIAQEDAGNTRMTDTREDEARRGFSIKSTGISLSFDVGNGNEYLVNLVDCPGRADFSAEVTASLRVTDGALVVVDCVEGVRVQTETVLRQAIGERIRPVLAINKLDRCFLELQMDGEDAYQIFEKIIENTNVVLSTYQDPVLGNDLQLFPDQGTVAFSSGLHGWAFTLTKFANIYASRFGVDEAKMLERLWGENFFDQTTGKWTNKDTGSPTCKRGFDQLCYKPIKQIIDNCLDDQKVKLLWPMLQKIGIKVNHELKCLSGKALMKRVLSTWLPAGRALLEMMIMHLPSPATAQRYRVENLYDGDLNDEYASAIRECDPGGPLMVYVSKMIPSAEKGRFFAFGRVFSGKVSSGMKVRIMGPNYVPGEKKDLYVNSVQRTVILMGKRQETVEDVPCGNMVGMVGLDHFITKTATLTSETEVNAHPIRAMSFHVSPVVRYAVRCKVASDLPKLVEGLKRLDKSDPLVLCSREETGEMVVSCAGELHLEICLKDLVDDFMGGAGIETSAPAVSFRETVLHPSSRVVMIKSPNKCNSLYMEARPLADGLAEAIDKGRIGPGDDPNARSRLLEADFGWPNERTKIWCFGPEDNGPNMMVDMCRGVQHLGDIRDSVVAGFQWASENGPLAGEKMRGVCVEVSDATIHPDSARRRSEQIIPAARRSVYGSFLLAGPRLMEPVFRVAIQAPKQALGSIYKILSKRRGKVTEVVESPGTAPLYNINAYLPVVESFGFSEELSASTSGQAFPQCVFDHWEIVASDPLEEGSRAAKLVSEIRERKGMDTQAVFQ